MGKSPLSIISFILNIVYVGSAVLLVLASVVYYTQIQFIKHVRTGEYYASTGMKWPEITPYIFFCVGALVILVALCGFGGAYSKTVLFVYVAFLTVTVGVSTAGSLVVYENNIATNKTDEFVGGLLEKGFSEIDPMEILAGTETAFGLLEEKYKCCGDDDPNKYLFMTREYVYPKSCCAAEAPCSGMKGNAGEAQMRRGCRGPVTEKTKQFVYYLWLGSVGVSVIGALNWIVAVAAVIRKVVKNKNRVKRRERTMVVNGTSVNSVSV